MDDIELGSAPSTVNPICERSVGEENAESKPAVASSNNATVFVEGKSIKIQCVYGKANLVEFIPRLDSTKSKGLSRIAYAVPHEGINHIQHIVRRDTYEHVEVHHTSTALSSTNDIVNVSYAKPSTKLLGVAVSVIQMIALALIIAKSPVAKLNGLSASDKLEFALLYYPVVSILLTGAAANELSEITTNYMCCPFVVAIGYTPAALYAYLIGGRTQDFYEYGFEFLSQDLRAWTVCQDFILLGLTVVASIIVVSSQNSFIEMLFNFGGVLVLLSLDEVVAKLFQLEMHTLTVIEYVGSNERESELTRGAPSTFTVNKFFLFLTIGLVSYLTRAQLDHPHDAEAIVRTLNVYAQDKMGGGEPLSKFAVENLVPSLISFGNAEVYFATIDNQVVGMALCIVGFSSFECKKLLNIHDFVVTPEHRGKGVGKTLMNYVKHEATQKGYCKITLEVLQGNLPAQATYRGCGFEPYVLDENLGHAMFWQCKLSC